MPTTDSRSAFFSIEDAKASFNLFCCVCGIGSLAMPSNFARAGPIYASIALAFMVFANTYATLKLSKVMLVSPSSVRTYGDLGEWALGKWGRYLTVVSQMGVCLLVPCAFLILGSTLLNVLFPDSFSQIFWIIFMAIMVVPMCLIPTLKESSSMAFAGCMGTIIADIIAVVLLQWNMRGHGPIPTPSISLHQILTCFGNLALAYGAAIVVPDLQREHSQPQCMPRVVMITILFISGFFVTIGLLGYTAGGCQLSGNILYSIVNTANPLGVAPLGFTADRGAVVMAYLFMQMHISIAFSTLMMPPFFMAERLILGMHKGPEVVRFKGEADQASVDHDMALQEKHSYLQSSTPLEMSNRQVSAASMVEKTEGRMSHLRVALEFGHEITQQELNAPYRAKPLRYIALRICIIVILVLVAVLARQRFLDLQDFTGATAHTTSCLVLPVVIYMRVCWKKMSIADKSASIIVIVVCAFAGFYVMIHAGEHLFSPSHDDTLFPYCEEEFMDDPYYVRNI
ncbi:amino acid auxin permease family [Plasmopara halstedii]|uniref:Amino acid auxin permease family n=1 Tax=Plasmopara halstedii TaxID=4781 RepID=A0A0P1AD15_PLAHL|nr:amino acid auxin permease family [Plasmopara halstedii]CEG38145.1 amino acid auxin permease family [Plasmopara halstedii]|eukprot:XP_024574514.1 amino acid auxin permease family [Plasmopara halstedii]